MKVLFRTGTETRHWKIQQDQGIFTIHPQPDDYDSLESVIKVRVTMYTFCSCSITSESYYVRSTRAVVGLIISPRTRITC